MLLAPATEAADRGASEPVDDVEAGLTVADPNKSIEESKKDEASVPYEVKIDDLGYIENSVIQEPDSTKKI